MTKICLYQLWGEYPKSLGLRLQPAVPWEWQEVHQVFPVLSGHGDIRA